MCDTKQETRADIIREMREQANEPTIVSLGEVFPPVGTEDVKDWADRIEAAVKREMAAIEAGALSAGGLVEAMRHKQVGNAAVMREALKKVLAAYKSGAIHTCAECYRDEWDDELSYLKSDVEVALSKPPRNCDRFATAKAAHEAFCSEPCEHPCGNCTVHKGEMSHDCFINWLFAKAEGGDHA